MGTDHCLSFIEYVGRIGRSFGTSCPHLFTEIKIFPEAGILMNNKAKDITCCHGFLASQSHISEELSARLRIVGDVIAWSRLISSLHFLRSINLVQILAACLLVSGRVSGLTRQTPDSPGHHQAYFLHHSLFL